MTTTETIETPIATKESFGKYTLTREVKDILGKDWFIIKITRPAKTFLKVKTVVAYRYPNEERREEYVAIWKTQIQKSEQEREQARAAKSEMRKNMVNHFMVGDILYDSWGYDQTVYDFYQVVETIGKSVVLRQLEKEIVEHHSSMTCYVMPKKDTFYGEPMRKTLQCDRNGKAYIKVSTGWLSPFDGKRNTKHTTLEGSSLLLVKRFNQQITMKTISLKFAALRPVHAVQLAISIGTLVVGQLLRF